MKKTNSTVTGTKLCIIHSLKPLNVATIQHSDVPPYTNQITKQFTNCACERILNLYIKYNEQGLNEKLHDYMTF